MQRVAFQLRLKPGVAEHYDEIHRNVWPELIAELEGSEVRQYSIFRRGQQLFLFMHVPDFELAMRELAASEINRRWQEKMAPFFEPVPDLKPEETFAMMEEVFFMRGNIADGRAEHGERASE